MSRPLTIVPIGAVQADDLDALSNMLSTAGFDVSIGAALDLPKAAYDPARDQYGAEALLYAIRRRTPGLVLGVADVDLYAAGLNFVFGIAEAPDGPAVIGLRRLRTGANERKYRDRMIKEAVHELGHSLGLGHCPDPACVMYFSNSLTDTDHKNRRFCDQCNRRLPRDLAARAG
jgi:archaemetzincin